MLRRGFVGVYRRMSRKRLFRRVREFAGQHNLRPLDMSERMKFIVPEAAGKRLRRADMTAFQQPYFSPARTENETPVSRSERTKWFRTPHIRFLPSFSLANMATSAAAPIPHLRRPAYRLHARAFGVHGERLFNCF